MKTDYENVFRHRGFSYHRAMNLFPGVRTQEFQNLFLGQPLGEGETIVDCPALGGYLASNLSTRVHVESLDFCPQGEEVGLLSEFVPTEKFDRVVCLAASHHIENLPLFLSELSRFLKVGGYLHLADVDIYNPIGCFLDEFVGQWTSTGHRGIWRDFDNLFRSSPTGELKLLRIEKRDCPWTFENQKQMIEFCRLLFGLDLDPSDDQVLQALKDYVGVEYSEGNCALQWRLSYADLVKDA